MRIYEADELRAMPSDLVREQDFVMRVRRMQRSGHSWLVLNLAFDMLAAVKTAPALKDQLQQQTTTAAQKLGGEVHIMANGDAFVVLELKSPAERSMLTGTIMAAAMPAGTDLEDAGLFLKSYVLPADYAALRERTNHYLDTARAAQTISAVKPSAQQALQGENVRGPLTAWSLSQIERLLEQVDIQRYIRMQPLYQRGGNDSWHMVGQEYYVGLEELKGELFPRVNVHTPERLFLELCCMLDKHLLLRLSETPEQWPQGNFSLNIAIETIFALPFAQFCHAVPKHRRGQISFELHRADLFLDFAMTRNAIKILRDEGFKVALDNIHPEMLPYLNLTQFDADFIKLKAGKEQIGHLAQSAVVTALRQIPFSKIIFFRCDNEMALEIGQKIGVGMFQGWLLDDVVNQKKE